MGGTGPRRHIPWHLRPGALQPRSREGPPAPRRGCGRRLPSSPLVGLLSRLHPAWFPDANQTAKFLEDTERLSYPLDYWNGLAALVAIGLPLLLHVARRKVDAGSRHSPRRACRRWCSTVFFTLSRGGIAAAFVAVAIYPRLRSDRLPKLLTALVAGARRRDPDRRGNGRDALQDGLDDVDRAPRRGTRCWRSTLVVCVVVGAGPGPGSACARRARGPAGAGPSRQPLIAIFVAAARGADRRDRHRRPRSSLRRAGTNSRSGGGPGQRDRAPGQRRRARAATSSGAPR